MKIPPLHKATISDIPFNQWSNSGRVMIQHTADDTAEMVGQLVRDITGKGTGDTLTEGELALVCAAVQAQGRIAAAAILARNSLEPAQDIE